MKKGIWALGIPAVFSLIAVLKHFWLLFAVFILTSFIVVGVAPVCKRRENLWMFISVAVSFIPVNIYLLMLLNEWDLVSSTSWILGGMQCVLYYGIVFSVEQIVMGVITRAIWKKQYKPAPEA